MPAWFQRRNARHAPSVLRPNSATLYETVFNWTIRDAAGNTIGIWHQTDT